MNKSLCTFIAASIALLFLSISDSYAQTVSIFAGGGSVVGNGGPAINAQLHSTNGIGMDAAGNIYIADYGDNRIRKVNIVTGIITTIAGTGVHGFYGDGGLAINAQIIPNDLCVDNIGNVYFIDSNTRIRKINAITGIITTVAGGGVFMNDNILATSADIYCTGIYVDGASNIYITTSSTVRKIDAITGIINTIIGTGAIGSTGDGGLATNATLNYPSGLTMDIIGNLYIAENNGNRIRRVDATTGIISTVVGTGAAGSSGDGGLATNAMINGPVGVCVDFIGNMYVADRGANRIRRVDATTGIITTLTTSIQPLFLCVDIVGGNLYCTDASTFVYKVLVPTPTPPHSSSLFAAYIANGYCSGSQFYLVTNSYSSGYSFKTFFGDCQYNNTTTTASGSSGYSSFAHYYGASGIYTVKHVLYNGTTAIDSLIYNNNYKFCETFFVAFYNDVNNNCVYDVGTDEYLTQSIKTEIDSSGIPIDTISSTSGFFYRALGVPGTVYTFKLISVSTELITSCPTTGIISTSLQGGGNNNVYFGLKCASSASYDLSVHSVIQGTGHHAQIGTVFAENNSCIPTNATVTLYCSPKYLFSNATPFPSSVSGSTITWNLTGLSSTNVPTQLYYHLETGGLPFLTPGDTVQTYCVITPTGGDNDTSNNHCGHTDTVRSSFDPNYVEVSPTGTVICGAKLRYTIEFQNTGNDTAHNIYIMDTLSNNIVLNSLAIVSASAVMNISLLNDGTHNIVKFDFPKINLLDTSHHGQCTGYVTFDINAKAPLLTLTTIDNHAGIFFDDNAVVLTNTVENTIAEGCATSVTTIQNKKEATIYPNPTNSILHIDNLKETANYHILNIIGQSLQQGALQTGANTISIQELAAGMYMLELTNDKGERTVVKLTKE